MARRRSQSDPNLDDLLDFLRTVPWWVGPPLMLLTWLVLHDFLPAFINDYLPGRDNEFVKPGLQMLTMMSVTLSPFITGIVVVVWIVALFKKIGDRRRLDRQTDIESIRSLSWREFELLLAEAYRRQGYFVEDTAGVTDGGIDLILTRHGKTTLVQAKQWKARKVGIKVVRELFGVQTSRKAHSAIVVTSGDYTHEARHFAAHTGITLVDGPALETMIASVQRSGGMPQKPDSQRPSTDSATITAPPPCPNCGKPMIQRTARRGANAGQTLWGCSGYPSCRGTRKMG